MKPLIFVPPAQAELLSDTQDELRSGDLSGRQPWRDEEVWDELPPSTHRSETVIAAKCLRQTPSFGQAP